MAVFHILSCLACLAYGSSVPPQVCFEPFNWGDCGKPPVHVLYYYKSGSRCEVGVWRGCIPNLNMFKDEYECVNTCVFGERAQPEDYHMMAGGEEIGEISPEIGVTDAHFPPSSEAEDKHEADQNNISDYKQIDSVPVDEKKPSENTPKTTLDATAVPPADTIPVPAADTTTVPTANTTTTTVPPADTITTIVPPADTTTTKVPPADTTTTAVPPADTTTTTVSPSDTTTTTVSPADTP